MFFPLLLGCLFLILHQASAAAVDSLFLDTVLDSVTCTYAGNTSPTAITTLNLLKLKLVGNGGGTSARDYYLSAGSEGQLLYLYSDSPDYIALWTDSAGTNQNGVRTAQFITGGTAKKRFKFLNIGDALTLIYTNGLWMPMSSFGGDFGST
jgi:hypothetical protein